MIKNISILILTAFVAFSCGSPTQSEKTKSKVIDNHKAFLKNLASLCGKSFKGKETYIIEGRESWAHKKFVMHVTVCENDSVHIPFHLDNDHSRTWKFMMEDKGLRFRHDHRHPDGTPEDKNLYGGYADDSGNEFCQHFPSDNHTLNILADGINRQWRVILAEDFSTLSYQLYYEENLIFEAEFDLKNPLLKSIE